MAVGILGVGSYIPRYRLSATTFKEVWGKRSSGERAVANHDEDTVTMGVEALLDCQGEPEDSQALFFASTTAPDCEKPSSSLLAKVLGLPETAFTTDFGNSLRSGTSALRLAFDMVKGGSARKVAVVAADCRLAMAGSDEEPTLGDGAAAVLVGEGPVIATLEGIYSLTQEFLDVWRSGQDEFINSADSRFVQLYGYERILVQSIRGLMEKYSLKTEDLSKVVFYSPDLRAAQGIIKALDLPVQKWVGKELLEQLGNTGTASPLLYLISALEQASPGDNIIVAGYGGGSDVIWIKVTEDINRLLPRLSIQLQRKCGLANYGKYLLFRRLVKSEVLKPYTSEILLWREQEANLSFRGQKCVSCGAIQYPFRRVCWQCGVKDNFTTLRLSKQGQVVTFTKDSLVPTPDPPVAMVVVDLDEGGRIYAQITDCDADRIAIGMRVQATFRKMHEGGGFGNYFWKFRPAGQREG